MELEHTRELAWVGATEEHLGDGVVGTKSKREHAARDLALAEEGRDERNGVGRELGNLRECEAEYSVVGRTGIADGPACDILGGTEEERVRPGCGDLNWRQGLAHV